MQENFIDVDNYTSSILTTCLPSDDVLFRLATLFDMFADCTRLKIIYALSISELCVSDLGKILQMNQSTLSHQLKSLKSCGVLTSKRIGKSIFYSAETDLVNDVICSGVDFLDR